MYTSGAFYKLFQPRGQSWISLDKINICKSSVKGVFENYQFLLSIAIAGYQFPSCAVYKYSVKQKYTIDKSKVPQISEDDLEEKIVKGGGPGGSNINKSINCVQLFHRPTGIVVKCQEDRSLIRNKKIARERLITKLDNLYNGEDSVENQRKRIEQKKNKDKQRKRNLVIALREKYKNVSEKGENS